MPRHLEAGVPEPDPLVIAGETFSSRLLLGTGGVPSLEILERAILASGSELVTVLQGSNVTYCYQVTNTGATALHDIAVNDAGGESGYYAGTLAPGDSITLSASALVWTDENNPATATGVNAPTGQNITPLSSWFPPSGRRADLVFCSK